jgi:hypothetical protein
MFREIHVIDMSTEGSMEAIKPRDMCWRRDNMEPIKLYDGRRDEYDWIALIHDT